MTAKFFIPKSSEWQLFGKQPCFLFGSTRPLADRRGNFPISIVKASCDPVECPVFGEKINNIAALPQPLCEVYMFLFMHSNLVSNGLLVPLDRVRNIQMLVFGMISKIIR
ncbi:MAG: hypothetical protein Q7U98_03260 [Methylicorpusculum sp.]|uniref:hypothetical protein n=1 Tax=Methylicorpusculum sp. TaxID=2713644 RepID=UPI0027182CA5|nr:hypothetical protein [Methylicorpusculum sp.]MDO8938161.1 hypothetical protein [Methylicorpusculum sp.]MDO9241815.1 hypothetical protein [Methylicorpusculum sp.]